MRILKSSIALLLIAVLVFSLTACGGNPIVGKWKYSMNFKEILEKQMESASSDQKEAYQVLADSVADISMDLILEFDDKNNVKYYIDEESANAAIDKFKEAVVDAIPKMFEAMGISESDLDEYLKAAGMTLDDVAKSVTESIDFGDFSEYSGTGTYRAENGKLYTTNEGDTEDTSKYLEYTISGNTLTITSIVGEDDNDSLDYFKMFLPMELTKVQ